MTIHRRTLLKGAAAMSVALAAPHVARAAARRMRFAHAANEVHPGHRMATSFSEALEELMPGAFEVQIFPNRQLGDDKQLLEGSVAGLMDVVSVSGVLLPLVTGRPAMNGWQMPFLIRDYDHFGELALGDIGQKILDDLRPAGLVGLAVADTGQRNFLSIDKAVTTLADFSGLKTRIVPVPLHQQIWETVGTAPVGLPYGEVYGALETGVIDAVEINVSSMLGENLWEVGKHFTLTGHYPWHMSTVMSERFFEGLHDEEKAAVTEAGRRSVTATLDYAKTQDLEGREELKSKGVEIVELSELDQMRDRVSDLTAEWSGKDPLIAELVAAAGAPA
ncbi:tripartite ATP-independent transporter solute receptor, DctP family [Salipiger thiooxidans]|uniref:Tripartite ATP-independent transporter solute receptor, DctP family n=1 Tax=Salipiger thiooxidans TaxID=282683 RepID=A0A1G7G7L0_9RHOB|nr:TRAP transporter substrate-binding protein [Salipiger thiooxidans]SDE84126.1 tripartite ATP-independent transporter solute receptor, DctP family [Salipiger thiooxidans]